MDAIIDAAYRKNGHLLSSSIALPLFSGLARSPYTGQDDWYLERIMVHGDLKVFAEQLKTQELQSWGKSQMLDIELGYNYALSEKWDIGVNYLFVMNLHNDPLPYTSIENIIYLGTTIKF